MGVLDPQLADLLLELQDSGAPQLYALSPSDARSAYAKGVLLLAGQAPRIARVVDTAVGHDEISVRLYYPDTDKTSPLPMVVFYHGGGWTFGSIETHDNVCRTFCSGADVIVASVEYGLAPEHKFPRAVNDAIAASKWARDCAGSVGADPDRIILAGDSAGANLAAVVALAERDAGKTAHYGQLLIYPATDLSMSCPSHRLFGAGYRLTQPLMVWSAANYLRDGTDMMNERASPLFAKNHSGLPPAIIVTAGFDPLRDEGAAYATKLRDAGVEVEYRCFESLIHGFINLTGPVNAAAKALETITSLLKGQLECHS